MSDEVENTIVSDEQITVWKEAVIASLRVLYWLLSGEANKPLMICHRV
jgi:hypothetical protein